MVVGPILIYFGLNALLSRPIPATGSAGPDEAMGIVYGALAAKYGIAAVLIFSGIWLIRKRLKQTRADRN
jgi:hypothetical protein